ncbi:MAG TPA: 1-deoxy-D-xylulose-5-phosphate reductoisomerase [Planctomycetota bacterium]|nr:1-deoxy-D-xylulose-5-phosphate reductoisomerase [Planctomycetota bacterium]
MKSLVVLGSTGSIGTQTLDVVRNAPDRLRVEGLAAGRSWEKLLAQVREFEPRVVAVRDAEAAAALREHTRGAVHVLEGPQALEALVGEADYDLAVHGVVGARGLPATAEALRRGRDVALANKESLVLAGAELMDLARSTGGSILPVDSELCALHQCLRGESGKGPPMGNGLSSDATRNVRRILLTASGGAFRDRPLDLLHDSPVREALTHPNWDMGPRITVGSATLMNKALEVLEVHHLFGLPEDKIHVVLHRQSVVHSMVEFEDGSVLAQMGPPDMRGPLHYCLHHPERAPSGLDGFRPDLFARLTFEEVDPRRYPSLDLGYRAVREGGDAGAVLNAADEVAVEAFLDGRIAFGDIHPINLRALEGRSGLAGGIEARMESDRRAREQTEADIASMAASN